MGSARTTLGTEKQEAPRLAEILEQYECGPIRFTGTGDALYDRHLMFDHVTARSAVGARERYEAAAGCARSAPMTAQTRSGSTTSPWSSCSGARWRTTS
jgi:starch phosphorylase